MPRSFLLVTSWCMQVFEITLGSWFEYSSAQLSLLWLLGSNADIRIIFLRAHFSERVVRIRKSWGRHLHFNPTLLPVSPVFRGEVVVTCQLHRIWEVETRQARQVSYLTFYVLAKVGKFLELLALVFIKGNSCVHAVQKCVRYYSCVTETSFQFRPRALQ